MNKDNIKTADLCILGLALHTLIEVNVTKAKHGECPSIPEMAMTIKAVELEEEIRSEVSKRKEAEQAKEQAEASQMQFNFSRN
jgi:hypothetical protein